MSELKIASISEPIAAAVAKHWSIRIDYLDGRAEFHSVNYWIYVHGGRVFPALAIGDEIVTSEALQSRYDGQLRYSLVWDGAGEPQYPETMTCECHQEEEK